MDIPGLESDVVIMLVLERPWNVQQKALVIHEEILKTNRPNLCARERHVVNMVHNVDHRNVGEETQCVYSWDTMYTPLSARLRLGEGHRVIRLPVALVLCLISKPVIVFTGLLSWRDVHDG
jgi:hypothetical protein